MRASSGNGSPPERYKLYRSANYIAARRNIERRYPRVQQLRLFHYVEAALRLFPPDENAEQVAPRTWLLATQEGINVPAIDVYFTVEDDEIHIEDAFAD